MSAIGQNQNISLTARSDAYSRSYPGFHPSSVSLVGSSATLNIISNAGTGSVGRNTGKIRFITCNASGGVTNFGGGNDLLTRMVIDGAGNVGIGIDSPLAKLSVNGNILANGYIKSKKLTVTQLGWSDYVFNDDYNLRSLFSLEAFIKKNRHLPEMASTKEVEQNGISVGDNQALLLKKIEELTLYLIQQDKKINRVIAENEKLKHLVRNKK
jgi:hypothetical protein